MQEPGPGGTGGGGGVYPRGGGEWVPTLGHHPAELTLPSYMCRNLVQVGQVEGEGCIPGVGESGFPLWVTLLQNWDNKTQELLLSFTSGRESHETQENL